MHSGGNAAHEALLPFKRVKTTEELDRELSAAKAANKPVLFDYYADWCVACKEMEKYTLPEPDVQAALARFETQAASEREARDAELAAARAQVDAALANKDAEVAAARAEVRLADALGRPDLTASLRYGLEQDVDRDVHVVLAGISMTLPLRARNQGPRAATRVRSRVPAASNKTWVSAPSGSVATTMASTVMRCGPSEDGACKWRCSGRTPSLIVGGRATPGGGWKVVPAPRRAPASRVSSIQLMGGAPRKPATKSLAGSS